MTIDRNVSGIGVAADISKGIYKDAVSVNNVVDLKAFTGVEDTIILKGYYTAGDGGGQVLYWDSTSIETANDGTIFQSDDNTVGRWKSVNTDTLTPDMFGTDGVDDTAAVLACLEETGSTSVFNEKTYIVTGDVAPTAVNINIVSNNATLKLKDSTACTNIILLEPEGLIIKGTLNIDGNRANGSTAAYGFRINSGVYAVDIDGIKINNVSGFGLRVRNITDSNIQNIITDNCGGGQNYEFMTDSRVRYIEDNNLNGTTSGVFQHCIDFQSNTNCELSHVKITSPDGSTAGPSTWLSGLTMVGLDSCNISDVKITDFQSSTLIPLSISILSAKYCKFSDIYINSWAGNKHIEYLGCSHCDFTKIKIDEDYTVQALGGGSEASNTGVSGTNGGELTAGSGARHQAHNANNTWTHLYIKGCNVGASLAGSFNTYDLMTIIGNKRTGIELSWRDGNTAYFGTASGKAVLSNKIANSTISCNGGRGLHLVGVSGFEVTGTSIAGNTLTNNGQEEASVSASTGITAVETDTTFIVGNDFSDTQSFTHTDGASFSPASLAANTKFTITALSNAERYVPGQRIDLVGSSPLTADLTVKVIERTAFDELEVIPISETTGTMTAPTTTKTGTITAVGTAVTGSGTLFSSEIGGRAFVLSGGEYRQIIRVISNTSLTLASAFTVDPSAAALNIVEVDINGVQSQARGADFSASTNSKQIVHANVATGNTSAEMLLNDDATTPVIVQTFTAADATPSVSNGDIFKTADTTTYTDFDDAVEGKSFDLLALHAATVTNGANIKTSTGVNKTLTVNVIYKFKSVGGVWYEQATA